MPRTHITTTASPRAPAVLPAIPTASATQAETGNPNNIPLVNQAPRMPVQKNIKLAPVQTQKWRAKTGGTLCIRGALVTIVPGQILTAHEDVWTIVKSGITLEEIK